MKPKLSLLWIGPGMGRIPPAWPATIKTLVASGMPLAEITLLDIKDVPKNPFPAWAEEHGIRVITRQGDFFKEVAFYDIILVDFIEAWLLGPSWWNIEETPWEAIRDTWEHRLQRQAGLQVWVAHDGFHNSTVIPQLADFDKVAQLSRKWPEPSYDVSPAALWWSVKAFFAHAFFVDVWQRR